MDWFLILDPIHIHNLIESPIPLQSMSIMLQIFIPYLIHKNSSLPRRLFKLLAFIRGMTIISGVMLWERHSHTF